MNSALDGNSGQTITARLNTDGITIVRIQADSVTHRMKVDSVTSSTAPTDAWSATDDNGRTTMFVVSSLDSTQLVALQATASGALLISK